MTDLQVINLTLDIWSRFPVTSPNQAVQLDRASMSNLTLWLVAILPVKTVFCPLKWSTMKLSKLDPQVCVCEGRKKLLSLKTYGYDYIIFLLLVDTYQLSEFICWHIFCVLLSKLIPNSYQPISLCKIHRLVSVTLTVFVLFSSMLLQTNTDSSTLIEM